MYDRIFCTFNNFTQDDGGTIRMRGIINALVDENKKILLISNCKKYHRFDKRIEHVFLNYQITKRQKKIFQTALAFLPKICHKYIFFNKLKVLDNLFSQYNIDRSSIIFFEYLDNSLGYLLQGNGIIKDYINDTHGIAPLEFQYAMKPNLQSKVLNYLKYLTVSTLDKKVMSHANKLLFVSKGMKEYYETLYKDLEKKNNFVLRDGTTKELCEQEINKELLDQLKLKYEIKNQDNIMLFIGDFKDFGGVLDLIQSFIILYHRQNIENLKLLLVGTGERFDEAKELIIKYKLKKEILLIRRISYSDVRTYQALASVIICPDKAHYFSELVPHIKYFDALLSNKIVINGRFKSIIKININEQYSLNFEPSNTLSLANTIEYALQNSESLALKFKYNKYNICQKYTYTESVKVLL